MDNQLAYWAEPEVNPNFQSRPPDPGAFAFLKNAGWDALYHSPFSGVYRMSEMAIEKTDLLNPGGNVLQPQEANEKYGMGGQLTFDEPIKEDAARLMLNRKIAENDRAYLSQSGATTGFRQVAGFGVGMAASLVDPINVAMMFVPVVGEARFAGMVARMGITRARLATGAIEGLVGSALAEPFILLPALQEQANYGLKDSALNLGFGAVLGAGLHAGLGAVGDKIRALKPKEANAIFESAMNDVLQDRPVSAPAKVFEFTDHFESGKMEEPNAVVEKTVAAEPKKSYSFVTKDEVASLKLSEGLDPIAHSALEPTHWFKKEEGAIVVKNDDGEVSGAASFYVKDDLMHISSLGSDKGKGFGRLLLNSIETEARSRGLSTIRLDSVDEAKGFYEKMGFTIDEKNVATKQVQPASVSQEPSINDIPLRDSRGKFLSKQKRLELLSEKINAENASRESLRGPKNDIDTQSIAPSDNLDVPSRSMDDSDVSKIDSQTADLEAELKSLDPEESKAIKAQIDELTKDIGNPAKRAKAVEAATNCIISRIL